MFPAISISSSRMWTIINTQLRSANRFLDCGRGLLLADNVLRCGLVATRANDADTRAIQQFNKMIDSSRLLFPVIVPLRDGVAVCRKV
jgi:predicted O-methyltransferase YrrM